MSALLNLPATRKEAIAAGSKHYFTGKACKHGHVAVRHVCGNCSVCHFEGSRRPEAKERQREYDRQYNQEYYTRPEVQARQREYDTTPKMREVHRNYDKTPKMRAYRREYGQRRYASKVDATPPWLTPDHLDEMRALYAESQLLTETTGLPRNVDHIIPLVHPDVCGLHVPWNLQILTATDNQRKHNAFDGTMENETWKQ